MVIPRDFYTVRLQNGDIEEVEPSVIDGVGLRDFDEEKVFETHQRKCIITAMSHMTDNEVADYLRAKRNGGVPEIKRAKIVEPSQKPKQVRTRNVKVKKPGTRSRKTFSEERKYVFGSVWTKHIIDGNHIYDEPKLRAHAEALGLHEAKKYTFEELKGVMAAHLRGV